MEQLNKLSERPKESELKKPETPDKEKITKDTTKPPVAGIVKPETPDKEKNGKGILSVCKEILAVLKGQLSFNKEKTANENALKQKEKNFTSKDKQTR